MFRYLAIAWNSESPAQREAASRLSQKIAVELPQLAVSFAAKGLCVWGASPPPFHHVYQLNDGAGVVLGTMFDRQGRAVGDALTGMSASDGPVLVRNYWGRYVAFMYDAASNTSYIIRDPSGGLYCFHMTYDGCDVYFSRVSDALALRGTYSIDWQYVAAHVAAWILDGQRTLLEDITELRPGKGVRACDGTQTIETYWSPSSIATSESIEDKETSRRVLRNAVKVSVESWASLHRGILVHISGGLDSSIILASLKAEVTRGIVRGLNYHAPGCDSDERSYARCIAQWIGCPLIERLRNSHVDLAQMLKCERSMQLDVNPLRVETSRAEAELAREIGATAVMAGVGGDQAFGSGRNWLGAADYARAHGAGRELASISLYAALLERRSIWSVLRDAVTHGILRRPWNPLDEGCARKTLVSEEATATATKTQREFHQWWGLAPELPIGKVAYLSNLCCRDLHDPLGEPSDPDLIHPLMSQPVIEAGLRIATYLMSCDGWDRGLARCTFEDDLPLEIARRRNKGGAYEHVLAIWKHNLPFARSMLPGGVLAEHGLLDMDEVAALLSDSPASDAQIMEAFHILSAEARLRAWVS